MHIYTHNQKLYIRLYLWILQIFIYLLILSSNKTKLFITVIILFIETSNTLRRKHLNKLIDTYYMLQEKMAFISTKNITKVT